MTWNHSMCEGCWRGANPLRPAVRMREPDLETCCFCGVPTDSGIYVRHDPETLDCTHEEDS